MEPLTDRQQQALEAIMAFLEREKRPPTTRELAGLLKRHQKTVCQYLDALERKGYIERQAGYIKLADEVREQTGLPLVGHVAAGSPVLAVENVDDYLSLDGIFGSDNGRFALRVRGDSMIDAHICDGDYVIVQQQSELRGGEIGVVIVGDEATVKRVYRTGRTLRLEPENSSYDAMEFDLSTDQVQIAGKVVGLIRRGT